MKSIFIALALGMSVTTAVAVSVQASRYQEQRQSLENEEHLDSRNLALAYERIASLESRLDEIDAPRCAVVYKKYENESIAVRNAALTEKKCNRYYPPNSGGCGGPNCAGGYIHIIPTDDTVTGIVTLPQSAPVRIGY